ncbi:MAG: hypothetical protein RID53_17300 [Coleofasciculus sp. B1-GNL1-01]|uniref:hypothetical protein n=1 Tax=Coleofasciculus sp. B1-GNL1-01 TaxID=3068484 RepID=UPI0032F0C5BF
MRCSRRSLLGLYRQIATKLSKFWVERSRNQLPNFFVELDLQVADLPGVGKNCGLS